MKLKEKLEIGDTIICLHMEDEKMMPGTKGVVTRITRDPFEHDNILYGVEWENGSSLNLMSKYDAWTKMKNLDKDKINENSSQEFEWFLTKKDMFKFFNLKVLVRYLIKLRNSGIVNMLASAPYLYMGKERIAHEFTYNEPPDEETFEELLNSADEAQREMINGVIKYLESNGKEITVDNINRGIKKFSQDILGYYVRSLS